MRMKRQKLSQRLGYFAVFMVLALQAVFAPLLTSSPAFAGRDLSDKFIASDIWFYDPGENFARSLCGGGGDCKIVGETREERLWSALRYAGFTPEQAAGLIGNILHEGGSPTRQEQAYINARNTNCLTKEGQAYTIHLDGTNGAHHDSCMTAIYSRYATGSEVAGIGLGIVQWTSHGRREGYLNMMDNLGLSKYFEGDAYKTYGTYNDTQLHDKIVEETGSDADYWALWCSTIKYMWEELNSPSYNGFFSQTTVEDYAHYAAEHYEVCSTCGVGGSEYTARAEEAERVYSMYQSGSFDFIENESSGDVQTVRSSVGGTCVNVTDPGSALSYLQQFIYDTNRLYGTNYKIPEAATIDVATDTPGDDSSVSADATVWQTMKDKGMVSGSSAPSGCWGGTYCGQCTSMSGWFVTMMTDYVYGGGAGGQVVSKMLTANSDLTVSSTPTAFSVFSQDKGAEAGHTGIVIGVTDSGEIVTIENNLANHHIGVRQYKYTDKFTFVDLSAKLRLNHLGEQF